MLQVIFILIIIFAIFSIQTPKLRRSIIYLGIFSLMCSFCYLLYSAPDVAIAEAVIGSTLSTILFLVAFQKYKVFTIYYTNEDFGNVNDDYISKGRIYILNLLEKFCISEELEPQVVYTTEELNHIINNHAFDLIIRQKGKSILIYGNRQNYKLDSLFKYINTNSYLNKNCKIYNISEGV